MLKLKLQYFAHLMQRANSLEETLMLGKIEGWRRRGGQDEMVGWYHLLNGHELEETPGDSEKQGSLTCCSPWGCIESDTTEWLKNNMVLYQCSIINSFLYNDYLCYLKLFTIANNVTENILISVSIHD